MIWTTSWRFDPSSAAIADRHYNRQKVGSPQFVPPGSCLVLRAEAALWVTSWPKFAQHDWVGAWINTLFRREGGEVKASDMIRQAVAASRWWFKGTPSLGMITFIDASKVRHKRDPGRCYIRAGFKRVGLTKKGLLIFHLAPGDMPAAEPPLGVSLDLINY